MSQANVALVRRFEELMLLGPQSEHEPYKDVLELLAPDVRFRVGPSLPHAGEWTGHDGFLRMIGLVGAARRVTDPSFTYLDAGDEHVVVLIAFDHEVVATGERGVTRMVEVITVRDDKIASLDPYYDDTLPWAIITGAVTNTPEPATD